MFTSVSALVALQRKRVPETLPALGALVWLFAGVYDLVSLQVALSFEGLPTGGADERPRICVYDLMSLQVHLCFERLVADLALVGGVLLLLVPQQVVLKGHRIPELPGTLVTGKRFLLFVSVHVLQQMELPVEALFADVAHKDPLCPPEFHSLCVLAVGGFGFFWVTSDIIQ